MGISEVVRGADLLASTARQLLLYQALGFTPPEFFHCVLVLDAAGRRLAKRHESMSLRKLRADGATPESLRGGLVKPGRLRQKPDGWNTSQKSLKRSLYHTKKFQNFLVNYFTIRQSTSSLTHY